MKLWLMRQDKKEYAQHPLTAAPYPSRCTRDECRGAFWLFFYLCLGEAGVGRGFYEKGCGLAGGQEGRASRRFKG